MTTRRLLSAVCIPLLLAVGCGSEKQAIPRSEASDVVEELEAEDGWFLERGTFAPVGKDVAFRVIERGHSRIGIWSDDTARLLTPRTVEAYDFGWMPDAKHLVVSVSEDGESDHLELVDLQGRRVRRIPLLQRLRLRAGIAVSSDGDTVIASAQPAGLLEQPADLVRIDLVTGEVAFVTKTPTQSEEYPSFLSERRVVVTTGGLVADTMKPSGQAVVLDLGSDRVRRLTPSDHVVAFASASNGGVIYDGYAAGTDKGVAIWVLPDPDARPEIVTAATGRFPSVSPAGDLLLLLRPGTPASPEALIKIDFPSG